MPLLPLLYFLLGYYAINLISNGSLQWVWGFRIVTLSQSNTAGSRTDSIIDHGHFININIDLP